MTLFPLDNNDKAHLKRLNENKAAIFALKKLFLNVCVSEPASNEAIKKITQAFHDLEVIRPDDHAGEDKRNVV